VRSAFRDVGPLRRDRFPTASMSISMSVQARRCRAERFRPLPVNSSSASIRSASSTGLPAVEPAANLAYSGQVTIVAKHGTLVTSDLGVLDAAHLAFTKMERPVSGTGVFANPGSNVFFISGSIVDKGARIPGKAVGHCLCRRRLALFGGDQSSSSPGAGKLRDKVWALSRFSDGGQPGRDADAASLFSY
jgi:hypothetical protein